MSIQNNQEENFIEIPVCKENNIEDGQIREENFESLLNEEENIYGDDQIIGEEKLNECFDQDKFYEEFKGNTVDFQFPKQFRAQIEKIIDLIKHQLFIFDSILRLNNYNTILSVVWRNQINQLGITDRYLLYGRLKQLKQLINQLKLFLDCTEYLFDHYDKEIIIYRQTEQLIQELQIDLISLQLYDNIDFEIKNFLNLETSYCFNYSFNMVKQNKILKIILQFILKIIDFSKFQEKKFDCQICRLKNQEINFVLQHVLNKHLQFIRFFNSILGKCLDVQCKRNINKYTNSKNYSIKTHTLKFHSVFYTIEKPLKFIFNQNKQLDYYGNRSDQTNKKFFQDFNKLMDKLPQIVKQQIEHYLLNTQQKSIKKQETLKLLLMNNVDQMKVRVSIPKLQIFDEICILIKMGWSKLLFLCGKQINFQNFNLPEKFNFIQTHNSIISLEFQEQILELIYDENEFVSLYNRLLVGYYNNKLTQNQFDFFLKELNLFIYDFSLFNLIINDKEKQLNSSCIFNGVLCQQEFDTLKQSFDHYFFGHQGISYCLCSSYCQEKNILRLNLDQIYFHCHDHHRAKFKNFISDYLKQQKLYYTFKATCYLCKIIIKTYSNAYWLEIEEFKPQKINFQIDKLMWEDLLYSYEQFEFVKNDLNIQLQEQYEYYIKENLTINEKEIAFNDKNQVAICQSCKQKKQNKMRHLNKTQFDNTNIKQTIQLARLCANINTKSEKIEKFSYPHLIGNIFAQSKKALLFIEGTDILYSINMNCAKIREKFKLMGSNEFERENVIKSCLHHHFLSNHCYQMASMSKFIIRQQEQLIILNKQLWRRYLEYNKIQDINDKLQLEFQKLQDLILFDDILHRNQIYYIYQNFNVENSVFMIDFIERLEEFFSIYQSQKPRLNNQIIYQFLKQFQNLDDEDQQFWKLTFWIYLYCEQLDDEISDIIKVPYLDSLIEYLLDTEILAQFLRRYSLVYVQKLLNNKIHPLYIGIMFQIKFQQFMRKTLNLSGNQENIIQQIFKSLTQQTLQICNLNPYLDNDDPTNYDFLIAKQCLYKKKYRWFEMEILTKINLTQFIDMNCRIKLIKYAFDSCYKNQQFEDIIQSDIKWTIQSGLQFLKCLKELKSHLTREDKKTIKQHLQLLKPLEDEINFYQNNFIPTNNVNLINKDSISNLIQDQVTPKFKNYEWIKKIHIVYFIPVEVKFQNMLTVHQTLRKIMDLEPFYQISKYYNISSFQKEIEYAIFPNLYPKAEGGLITKAPSPNKMQLIIDIEKSEKSQALKYSKDIGDIRKQNQEIKQQVTNSDLNNNIIYLNLELSDFTTQQKQGNPLIQPQKAIFNIQEEEALHDNLSLTYVYKWQYLSIYHYEKARLINIETQNKDDEIDWPQVINLKLRINNDFLNQSVLEKHVTSRLDQFLSKKQQQWDNEQKQYLKQLKQQTDQMKKLNKRRKEIESFVIEQEKIFLQQKLEQIIKNEDLTRVVEQLREIQNLEIDSSSSMVESEEEQTKKKCEQHIDQVQTLLRSKTNSIIKEKEQADDKQNQQDIHVDNKNLNQQYMQFTLQQQNLCEDTKFKLNCSFTKLFQKSVQWIFWRFYEWLKQKFYCYQLIVNKEKGTLLQNMQQIYQSIPPIQGTDTYFSDEYNKLKTFCFYEGIPLFFLTITMNEFNEKTFKLMRGLNFLNLEQPDTVEKLQKKNIRYDEINQNANNFVDFFLYLMKHYKKAIKNKFQNQVNPHKEFKSYEQGLFGNYKALITRIEFQKRGSLHFHLFIFLNTLSNNNDYSEKFIQYLLGEFSSYNQNQKKDIQFLRKYDLFHHCSIERCITKDTHRCRLGFPKQINKGYYVNNHPIDIQQRRLQLDDEYVITFQRDTVKFFNSNCQINICNDENILGYLTKYINKNTKQTKNIVGKESAQKKPFQAQSVVNDSIMDQVKNFLDKKETSLQEAYFAFKQTSIIETSFKVIKIKQQPISIQISSKEDILDQITLQNIEEQFEINSISSSCCINRPNELEYLNFFEYSMMTIFYGKKQYYLDKIKKQLSNIQLDRIQYIYFFDQNSNIIKIKENKEKKQTILQTSQLHPSKEYQGANNVYYLQMLQLYWPHRKNEWIQTTHDTQEGFYNAYQILINSFDYPNEENIQNQFRKKYCKFQQYPLKQYVEMYNNLQQFQIRILENLYRFNFNYENFDINYKNYIKVDYIIELINQIEQQIDQENQYQRVNEIKIILQYLNPTKIIDELCKQQINDLVENIKQDVQMFWNQLSQISKFIIINLGLICKEYGSDDLYMLCPKQESVEKYFFDKKNTQTQSINNLNINQAEILSQIQDDFLNQDPCQYRRAITIVEYEEGKIYRQIQWDKIQFSDKIFNQWDNLKKQQKLCIIFMLQNILLNYPTQNQIKISEGSFIHGPGGVGKTHLIMFMIQFANECGLNYNILTPTQQGVQNLKLICRQQQIISINAQTIHSFFQLKCDQTSANLWIQFEHFLKYQGISNFNYTNQIFQKIIKFQYNNRTILEKTLRGLDILIIEEVSMIDPFFLSLLDIYSQISRRSANQFGGIQVFIFGDSYQLQPVQEKQIQYFNSHIFKSNYFSLMIELTETIRQQSDKVYYQDILLPIRKGIFHQDPDNFNKQLKILRKRVIQINSIGPTPKITQELDKKNKDKEQIICLFFTNESADFENYKRAKKILDDYNKDIQYQKNNLTPFRKYIYHPIQFSFNQEQTDDELLILILNDDYKLKEEFVNKNQSYNNHYLLLPIGIRNQLARRLGIKTYNFATHSKQICKAVVQKEITLFEHAEIVIRKNIDKKNSITNGQFAKILGMSFDIDYQSLKSMRKFLINKKEYIQEHNLYDIIQVQKKQGQESNNYKFCKTFYEEIKQYGVNKQINNVNFVMEKDITQEEKLQLYESDINPRLQQLLLNIDYAGIKELQLYQKKFILKINISKQEFIIDIQDIIDQIEMTISQYNFCLSKPRKLQQEMFYKFLKNNNLIKLFFIDIINEKFGINYLLKVSQNLKSLIEKMPDQLIVYLHQIPINLGYARTIHTAQGSTIQNVIIDLQMAEEQQHGLLYTAMSRVQNLENLFFSGKFEDEKFKVRVNEQIEEFFQNNFIEADYFFQHQYFNNLIQLDFENLWVNVVRNVKDIREIQIEAKQQFQKQRYYNNNY